MNKSHLKIVIHAAGSNLEIFPNANIRDELKRIEELYESLQSSEEIFERQFVRTEIRHYEHLLNNMFSNPLNYKINDKEAFQQDWHNIGKDFSNAIEEANSFYNDEAECRNL